MFNGQFKVDYFLFRSSKGFYQTEKSPEIKRRKIFERARNSTRRERTRLTKKKDLIRSDGKNSGKFLEEKDFSKEIESFGSILGNRGVSLGQERKTGR